MKKKIYIAAAAAAVLLISGMFSCPVYWLIGIPCPTCGMTRAWQHLIFGDIKNAFGMHPLFWLPAVFLIPQARRNWVIVMSLAILIVAWIVRMAVLFPGEVPINYNYESLLGGIL